MTLEDFRDPGRVRVLLGAIRQEAEPLAQRLGRPLQIMEVCGGHTHAIFRFGLDQLLPKSIEFIHGPGCPVCVLPVAAVDQALALAERGLVLASFGDPMRVPGTHMSLLEAKAKGMDVRILYSPLDALALARKEPGRQFVFFSIGFDTTMPAAACSLLAAAREGLGNLRFLCHHIRLMPTLEALLTAGELRLDGFVGPGHVATVIGAGAFAPVAARHGKPLVIAGFEPVDFLQALYQLLLQLKEGRCAIENAYGRVVSEAGNLAAQAAIAQAFEEGVDAEWRGLGLVPGSGVRVREAFRDWDAAPLLAFDTLPQRRPEPCQCSQVLIGRLKPNQCPHFGKGCSPQHPLGALMVSTEGACAAYHQYKEAIHG
ncbi:hydrogenase formation protein HypD [Gallaecimonas kandeliae]|uniref:hydrogenase formation protein HypD n=1 Tax=Gallaecimonas kandeliae TaxID=3029055 RepID=UPI002649992D|nr:hydrogenase formation protein HypD [Gallaecimonas kandeliae]WKE64213.1 hydrogenase formation protein HypD [Gallaecimonas kandeliae]